MRLNTPEKHDMFSCSARIGLVPLIQVPSRSAKPEGVAQTDRSLGVDNVTTSLVSVHKEYTVLTAAELAARWRMSGKSLSQIMHKIPGAFRPGGSRGHWRISLDAVSAYEASQSLTADSEPSLPVPEKPMRRPLTRTEIWKRHSERHPDRTQARRITAAAIRSGKLTRKPCRICGSAKSEAHHKNYADPFDLDWLCRRCHRIEGHNSKLGPVDSWVI
jgi:hypothetical protein